MKIGATFLFKNNNSQKLKGVLKSVVIDANNMIESTKIISDKISNYYNYNYLGINDLFLVSGEAKSGELLGRTTYYELNSLEKSRSLISSNKIMLNDENISKTYNCSLVYFCENAVEKFTISVLSIVKSNNHEIIFDVESLAENVEFLRKIKSNSLEEIKEIEFIGIEMICNIDLKFGVFQSFYSDFDIIEDIKDELLSNEEITEILADILE